MHLHTVRDLLRFAVSRFNETHLAFGHGSTNAYDEAAYLILHTLHLPLDTLEPFLDAHLLPVEIEQVLAVLDRRSAQRIPAAYITHEAWLGEFKFYVDERVIVPRSFIAELLGDGLSHWLADPDSVHAALDLCTGSGCLAVLLAHAFPQAKIDAADISADALEVAKRNIADYKLQDRVQPVLSDLYAALGKRRYDLIISNPPYVTAESMRQLPKEYRHEPQLALASGQDGLDAIRVILRDAPAHLQQDGWLVVETGHARDRVEAAFPRHAFTWPETSGGDDCVFVISRDQLLAAA